MGVMGCNVNGCNHVLCDRYSDEYGYICGDCFEKLIEYINNHPEIPFGANYDNIIKSFFNRGATDKPDQEWLRKVLDNEFPYWRD